MARRWLFSHRSHSEDTGSSDPAPVPPVNVRVMLSDQTTVPVECLYVGRVGTIDRWEAIAPVQVKAGEAVDLLVDELPPCCEIVVRVRGVRGS